MDLALRVLFHRFQTIFDQIKAELSVTKVLHLTIIHLSTTFTDTEVNNCFSIYHTSWITSDPKSNFICDNTPTKAILFSFGCSEVNSTWLITSELANQRARKVLFTCVVYTNREYLTLCCIREGNKLWLLWSQKQWVLFPSMFPETSPRGNKTYCFRWGQLSTLYLPTQK